MLLKRAKTRTVIVTTIMLLLLLLVARIAALSGSHPVGQAARTEPVAVQTAQARVAAELPRTWHAAYTRVADRHPEIFVSPPVPTIETLAESEPAPVSAAVVTPEPPAETTRSRTIVPPPTEPEAAPAAEPKKVKIVPDNRLPRIASYSPRRPGTVRVAHAEPAAAEPVVAAAAAVETVLAAPAAAEPVSRTGQPTPRYQRLDQNGEPVSGDQPWSCVRDNRSDLVWEVKTNDAGLRDAGYLYTWFDSSTDGRDGVSDGGRCGGGIDCDTHAYQVALNRQALCGFDDWRLPSKQELQTLVALDRQDGDATIDRDYFPAAAASWYWTASSNEMRPGYAWYVLFRNGIPLNDLKARPKHIRLVRGNRMLLASKK
jgi:hypothetical protein